MAFIRFGGQRSMLKGLDRQKMMLLPALSHMSTTSPPNPPKDGQSTRDTGSSGKTLGIGALLAIGGGLSYAYYKHGDDEMVRSKIDFIKEKTGFAKHSNMSLGAKILGSENEASCTGKDPCEKKCEDSDCLRKMDKEEEMIAKANADLEKALKDVKPKAVEATDLALKAYCEATEAIRQFMDRAYCAIEDDHLESPQFEEIWCEVYELAVKRCEKVKDALNKGQCAWELLCRLREVIDNGKNCKYTSCNPLLLTAEETLLCAERELLNAKARMDCIQSESKLVEQYRNLVEDFRRDLKAEVDSLLTGDKECRSTLTENECAMILTHAYKKVIRIQMELSQCQAKSFNLGFDDIKRGRGGKMESMKEFYEGELIKALSRQNMLYQENFELARQVLNNEFEARLKEKDGLVQAQHLEDLVKIYKRAADSVDSVKSAINEQKIGELNSGKLRKLWAYCNSLYSRINFADHTADPKDIPITINKDQLIAEFSGDKFVVQLLETIPTNVQSNHTLKMRFFNKINTTCRKLATFRKDEQFSLWKYGIGTIQGWLTSKCEGENTTPQTVYELLDRTAYYLQRGELVDAVATLNKLEGLPREVCKDWLLDARSAMEVSQTLFALMVHANSTNFQ